MAIVLTRFSPGPLTAAQLNAVIDAITAKFNGGVTTGDILWPLKAGGNLDMSQFEVLHLYKFWQARNLAERASTTTLQNVLDEVNTAGGGVVILPANSTETVGTAGVTIGSNTLIMGQGETSIFATSGTLTNHMFRNKANGNTGIMFMNVVLNQSGSGGGTFDIVAMQRVSRMRFVDCRIIATQQHGVALRTDSAGSSNVGAWFDRCQFDVNSNADSGIFMEDAQRIYVSNCEFNVTASTSAGISCVANGGTSNLDTININNNAFLHSSGTTQISISVSGPATTGIKRFHIINNEFVGGGTNSFYIDVNAGVSTVRCDLNISSNSINGGSTTSAAIRLRNCLHWRLANNTIEISGAGIGVLIGATARSGSAATCRDYTVTGNSIVAAESCIVFCHPGSGTMFANASGNTGSCSNAAVAEFEIWNLAANPTTLTFDAAFNGMMVDESSASVASWRCYTGVGATQGGRAGSANDSNLIISNNNMTGVTFGTVGANDDFHTTSDGITRRYTRENNIL